jgi:hypothetical protein
MWQIALLMLLQMNNAKTAQPAPPPPPVQPGEAAPTSMPILDQGPLRCEPIAVADLRFWYKERPPQARESQFQTLWRVEGERVTEAARTGNIILTEAIDDTGKSLFDPNSYTEEYRTTTRLLGLTPEQIRHTGVRAQCGMNSPSRSAHSISLKGSLLLVLAPKREEITVANPLQYVGKNIENPRLKELGIVIRVVPIDELELGNQTPPPPNELFVLQYVEKPDNVNTAVLYDAWMKRMRYREQPNQTKKGERVHGFAFAPPGLTDQDQLVFEVFPTLEEVHLPIVVDNLELP